MIYLIDKRQSLLIILFVISGLTTLTVAYGTLPTDYFRSNVTSGNWSASSSWQSSSDNVTWYTATASPTNSANVILIRSGNTINVSTAVSLDQTTINGELQIQNAGSITIYNGSGDDVIIASGGVLRTLAQRDYSVETIYNTSSVIRVSTGGKVTVGNGGSVVGTGYHDFTNGNNVWETGAIYEWNATSTFAASSITYFLNAPSTIPIFRITMISGNPGGSNPTTINGVLEVNTPVTLVGSGAKTLRDGVSGSSILTLDGSLGTTYITSSNAVLGGSLTLILNKTLNLANGITVPTGANVLLSSSATFHINKDAGSFIVNGTIDITDRTISNTSGNFTINGTIKTSKTNGFYSPGNVASGTMIINTGSTVEYNGMLSQSISTGITYANLAFSGNGTKTSVNAITATARVSITGTAIVDFTNYNLTGVDFAMNSGRLIVGTTGTLPGMTGTYNLTGGVVQFAGPSNQSIRSKSYQNIEVTGAGVKNSSGNITLNDLGTFTIKTGGVFEINADAIVGPTGTQTVTVESGGTFKCGNVLGFHGTVAGFNSPSVRIDIETINLNAGSVVEYSRSNPPLTTADQLITNTVPYHHLHVSGSGIKTAPSGTLVINGDLKNISGTPVFAHNNGMVLFNGTVLQTYHVLYPGFIFYNLTSANPVNLLFASKASIAKQLSINSGAKIRLDTSNIVLLSAQANTANVDKISSADAITYNGLGRFIVERFIGTGITHGKTWQLLSVPTHGFNQSINAAWQEGNTPLSNAINPGYGTTLTSNVANAVSRGFDFYTAPGPSIKIFNTATANWVGIDNGSTNTNAIPIENKKGYMILVRGDRSVQTSTGAANQTIMRTAGKLYAPGNPPPATSVLAGYFESVGNPYASAIDFKHIEKTTGIDSTYYVWDPLLTGAFGLGAYQTFIYDFTAGKYEPTPGGGSYAGGNNKIESGQAFLIHSAGPSNGTITFTENCKVSANNLVAREQVIHSPVGSLKVNLHSIGDDASSLIDGTKLQFSNNYADQVDGMDALKINNAGENICIKVLNKFLAVERRQPVEANDTIFYTMYNMRQQSYQLQILPANMRSNGLKAWLVDQYLQTKTEVSMNNVSAYSFQVTSVPASSMLNRFYIVFNVGKKFIEPLVLRGQTKSQVNELRFKGGHDADVAYYSLERSKDGKTFETIEKFTPNPAKEWYAGKDVASASMFYRVQSFRKEGGLQQSEVVHLHEEASSVVVYPNPLGADKMLNISFKNYKAGTYSVELINASGLVLQSKAIDLTGKNQTVSILLSALQAHGNYTVTISEGAHTKTSHKIVY